MLPVAILYHSAINYYTYKEGCLFKISSNLMFKRSTTSFRNFLYELRLWRNEFCDQMSSEGMASQESIFL